MRDRGGTDAMHDTGTAVKVVAADGDRSLELSVQRSDSPDSLTLGSLRSPTIPV